MKGILPSALCFPARDSASVVNRAGRDDQCVNGERRPQRKNRSCYGEFDGPTDFVIECLARARTVSVRLVPPSSRITCSTVSSRTLSGARVFINHSTL